MRFWKGDKLDPDGRAMWLGSAVYDKGVGPSHTTGQITHHTAANVDAERDYLPQDRKAALAAETPGAPMAGCTSA